MEHHNNSLFYGELVNSNRIIYTPSAFAKANLLHLQEVGELKAVKPHVSSREELNSYLFFMVTEGSGTLTYNGKPHIMSKGDCGFIDCRKPYSHKASERELWTLKWVHFFGPNMAGIYDKYLERGGEKCFSTAHFEEYEALITQIQRVAGADSYIKDMEIAEKLMSLLTLLMEESWNPGRKNAAASKRRDMTDVKAYLDEYFAKKISLDDLAGMFYINKYYLLRSFREQFGITVNAYLTQVRVTHAKSILRFSDRSVEQVAEACGMEDANYFIRVFKKVEGITPGEYRKKW